MYIYLFFFYIFFNHIFIYFFLSLWFQFNYNGNLFHDAEGIKFLYTNALNRFISVQPHVVWLIQNVKTVFFFYKKKRKTINQSINRHYYWSVISITDQYKLIHYINQWISSRSCVYSWSFSVFILVEQIFFFRLHGFVNEQIHLNTFGNVCIRLFTSMSTCFYVHMKCRFCFAERTLFIVCICISMEMIAFCMIVRNASVTWFVYQMTDAYLKISPSRS